MYVCVSVMVIIPSDITRLIIKSWGGGGGGGVSSCESFLYDIV